jgi:hypothetical protein
MIKNSKKYHIQATTLVGLVVAISLIFGSIESINASAQIATTPSRPQPPKPTISGFQYPTLIIITHVNNTGGGKATAAKFNQTVTNVYRILDGYVSAFHFTRGSEYGVILKLQPGIFSVSEQQSNKTNSLSQSYSTTILGDCHPVKSKSGTILGVGLIKAGEIRTCIVTNTFHR